MKSTTWPSSRKRKNLDDNWSVSVKLASQEICIGQQNQSNKGYELVMSHRTTPQLE
jgi:hypothetical protein